MFLRPEGVSSCAWTHLFRRVERRFGLCPEPARFKFSDWGYFIDRLPVLPKQDTGGIKRHIASEKKSGYREVRKGLDPFGSTRPGAEPLGSFTFKPLLAPSAGGRRRNRIRNSSNVPDRMWWFANDTSSSSERESSRRPSTSSRESSSASSHTTSRESSDHGSASASAATGGHGTDSSGHGATAGAPAHWSYDGADRPSHWGDLSDSSKAN